MDTVNYMAENGSDALRDVIEKMNVDELKAVIKENCLDPCRQYARTKNVDMLKKVIMVVTEQRCFKGYGFI